MNTRLTVAVLLAALAPPALAQEVSVVDAGEWIARDGTIRLRLNQALASQAARLRVVAAGVDVTSLARFPRPGQMEIDARAAALPAGESALVVYLIEDTGWREVLRTPLKLLARGGFEKAEFTPKLDLAGKSQFAQTTTGSTSPPPRPQFADLTGRGSAGFGVERGGFSLDGQFNGAGSSFRPEALRYGELRERADKFDLSDYTLNAKVGGTTVSLGHLSYGNNPLLLSGFSSRGMTIAQRFGERVELSFNAMNGTSIVGTDNFFGLDSAEHRVVSGGVGYEFFPRAGALRAEVLYMDASVQSRSNFNVGEIPDAEKSFGIGLRVSGASDANRVRGEAVFARSTYVNPFDPQLAQGGTSQAVRPATANGYSTELSADLLRDARVFGAGKPLTLTASLRHERVAPLFRSLGASLSADQRVSRAALGAQIAGAQLQLTRQQQQDNLENIATLLTTRTNTSALNASMPLPQWLGANAKTSLWPALSYQWQHVQQVAQNAPVIEDSGIAATHRPDQLNRQHQLGFTWAREIWSWNYSVSASQQDNRQVGRERADFATLGHQLSTSLRASDTLNLTFGVQRNRNFSREKELVSYSNTGTAGCDWTWRDRWTLAANYGRTLGDDSRALAASANRTVQGQLGFRFDVRSFGRKLPGQVFVRYSDQADTNRDATFGISSAGGNRSWNAGLSLSLF